MTGCRQLLVYGLLLASCTSLKLDDSEPFASLRGSPPSMAGRQQLHRGPNEDTIFVRGVDGVPWATQNPLPGDTARFWPWLVRLGDPPDELILYNYGLAWITSGAFFDFTYDVAADQTIAASHLTMTRPGAPAARFDFDAYVDHDVDFTDSENEAAFFVPALGTLVGTGYIVRTDGSFRRLFNLNGTQPTAIFDLDGEVLFTFDMDGVIRAHSAREQQDAAIGAWSISGPSLAQSLPLLKLPRVAPAVAYPPLVAVWPDSTLPQLMLWRGTPQLTACDDLGLRTLQFKAASPLILDGDPCVAGSLFIRRDHLVYYARGGQNPVLRSVPLDGSAPPVALPHADVQPLAVDAERIAWSTSTAATLGNGPFSPSDVGDGWVDEHQFMERGLYATFSADGRHLYFLEHAATGDRVGELRSYEIATGTTHVLALNTRQFAELPDGRLMAVTNASSKADWNRVVVIDEARRTIDWVADSSDGFTPIPGRQDVLVDLVMSSDETPMVRMPIPEISP